MYPSRGSRTPFVGTDGPAKGTHRGCGNPRRRRGRGGAGGWCGGGGSGCGPSPSPPPGPTPRGGELLRPCRESGGGHRFWRAVRRGDLAHRIASQEARRSHHAANGMRGGRLAAVEPSASHSPHGHTRRGGTLHDRTVTRVPTTYITWVEGRVCQGASFPGVTINRHPRPFTDLLGAVVRDVADGDAPLPAVREVHRVVPRPHPHDGLWDRGPEAGPGIRAWLDDPLGGVTRTKPVRFRALASPPPVANRRCP